MNLDDDKELDSNDDVPRFQVSFSLYRNRSLLHGLNLKKICCK